jgi:cation diffusion facilitator family transporter
MDRSYKYFFIPDYGDPTDPIVRAKYGYLEGVVSITVNIVLFIVKLILGLFLNSIALIADSFHTLSDVGTSAVVIIGFKVSKKPPDAQHPFGYGRVEYIATLIIAVLLVIVGLGFIQQSVERLINSVSITNEGFVFIVAAVLVISAFIKEWMARFSLALGYKINSDILIADAWHHRSDALAAVGVAVSIIGSTLGYMFLDPVFGVVVSVIIIWVGLTLVKSSSNFLIGRSPDSAIIASIERIGRETRGIKGMHDLSIHDYGSNKVVTLHAEVDNDMSLEEAHAVADTLEQRIREETSYSTIIHVEPRDLQCDHLMKKGVIENILRRQKEVISFHNIQIIRHRDKDYIAMHLVVDRDMPVQKSHDLCHRIETLFQGLYSNSEVHIHLEPCREKDCVSCRQSCQKKHRV